MLLVWPGAPFVASLLLVVMPGASSSFLLLVAMEGPFNATRWIECLRFGLEAQWQVLPLPMQLRAMHSYATCVTSQ